MDLTLAQPLPQRRGLPAPILLWSVVLLGVLGLTVQRLWLLRDLPLWLDETWTAVIVSQTSWSSFWREAWLDCNPPLYYAFMAVWTEVAGLSNHALRAPSLLFVGLAAIAPVLWKAPGLTRDARLAWGALIFLWWPGVVVSVDARGYAMLLFISAAQAVAFAGLLQSPTTRKAAIWAALASAAILTHYYALYVAAVQGLLYLYEHRLRAVRTWPAALAFAPAFGWLLYHLPRLADYARPDVAWYGKVRPLETVAHLAYISGASTIAFLLCAAAGLVASIALRRGQEQAADAPDTASRHLWLTAASGILALLLAWAIGMLRPTLAERYLTPIVPLALLGIVLAVRRLHGTTSAYAALVAIYLVGSATPQAHQARTERRNIYGYERASEFLMRARPNRLVFTWDHPAAKILDRGSIRQIGGFFFDRAGHAVETIPVVIPRRQDPNRLLLAQATGERPAILWLYNTSRASAARRFPPRIDRRPGWRCLHERDGPIGVVACAPAALFGR